MTKSEAQAAMENGRRIVAGNGSDRDYGRVHSIDGDVAVIGWESGVNTPFPITDLEAA